MKKQKLVSQSVLVNFVFDWKHSPFRGGEIAMSGDMNVLPFISFSVCFADGQLASCVNIRPAADPLVSTS